MPDVIPYIDQVTIHTGSLIRGIIPYIDQLSITLNIPSHLMLLFIGTVKPLFKTT